MESESHAEASLLSLPFCMDCTLSTLQVAFKTEFVQFRLFFFNFSKHREGYRFTKMTFLHVFLEIPLVWFNIRLDLFDPPHYNAKNQSCSTRALWDVYPEVLRALSKKSPFFLSCFSCLGEKSQKPLLKRLF